MKNKIIRVANHCSQAVTYISSCIIQIVREKNKQHNDIVECDCADARSGVEREILEILIYDFLTLVRHHT